MATLVNVAYIAVKPNWIVTTTARAMCHMRHTWQGEEKGIGRVRRESDRKGIRAAKIFQNFVSQGLVWEPETV